MSAGEGAWRDLLGAAGRQRIVTVTPDEPVMPHPGGDVLLVYEQDLALTSRGALLTRLRWLHALSTPVAVVASVTPIPGRGATLLAPDVWRALFEAAGLHVVATSVDHAVVPEDGWGATWGLVDPWRGKGEAAVRFLLAPAQREVEPTTLRVDVRALAGPQYERVAPGRRLGFLVAGYQDFHTVANWVARLRPEDVVVFLRDPSFGGAAEVIANLRAACAALAVPVVTLGLDPTRDLQDARVEVLVAASESPANLAHVGNAAVLLMARQAGIATAHAQHGVWPRAEFPPPIVSVADAVLAWSDEYAEVMQPEAPVHVVGAPRFDRYEDATHRSCRGLYGGWTTQYARHVVVGTNLHWQQHAAALDARSLVTGLAARFPQTLFTWKPHPYEAAPALADLPANVVVLPEAVMLAADLEAADLIEAADAVVTTPSTLALEAALAGTPCLVVSTGNANRHDFVREALLGDVDQWLSAPASDPDAAAYAARYDAPHTRGQALGRALQVLGTATPRPLPAGVASIVGALYGASLRTGAENVHLRASLGAASSYVDSLVWTLERKDRHIADLHTRLPPRE